MAFKLGDDGGVNILQNQMTEEQGSFDSRVTCCQVPPLPQQEQFHTIFHQNRQFLLHQQQIANVIGIALLVSWVALLEYVCKCEFS